MAKKFQKVLTAGLSLTLCAAMVMPSFAASFTDLQNAIDRGTSVYKDGHDETSTAVDEEKYAIKVETADGSREIILYEDVNFGESRENPYQAGIVVDGQRLHGQKVDDVTIDLNGYDIDLNPNYVLDAEENKFYAAAKDEEGNVIKDENGDKVADETRPAVSTNAGGSPAGPLNQGTVITAKNNANLTINDSSALDEDGNYVPGQGTGSITGGNRTTDSGQVVRQNGTGAVYVGTNSSFTMNGGSISGNHSENNAICVENPSSGNPNSKLNVNLNGVTVENNRTGEGTIYFTAKSGEVNAVVNGCVITGNVAGDGANSGDVIDIGIHNSGKNLTATFTDTVISENTLNKVNSSPAQHGAVAIWVDSGKSADISFEGCTVQGNMGGSTGIYYYHPGSKDQLAVTNTSICGNGTQGQVNNPQIMNNGRPGGAMHTGEAETAWVEGELTAPNGTGKDNAGAITYVCPYCNASHEIPLYLIEVDGNGATANVPGDITVEEGKEIGGLGEPSRTGYTFAGWVAVDADGNETAYDPAMAADGEIVTIKATWTEIPADIPGTTDPSVTIDDPEVPLAGLFTRADAIGYLWEQEGSPDWELSEFPDVPEDHQWAVAIGWAEDMGIALPDEDGNFRPDDLVLRYVEDLEIDPEGEFEEFLNRFAVYAGIELDDDELFYELGGIADDIVMGEEAQEIFDAFFAKLEAALRQAA